MARTGATGVQLGEDVARMMIIQAASRVVYQRGARAPSVDDFLTESNVSRRTFYRFFRSKEDVLLALYKMGTDRLLDQCRSVVVGSQREPLKQSAGFIDAHLTSARFLGRLVFVLGGEAQRQESALHPRRMEVIDAIMTMLVASLPHVDPLLVRVVVMALESATRMMLAECDEGRQVTAPALARVRAAMLRMATATLFGAGDDVAPLPGPPTPPGPPTSR